MKLFRIIASLLFCAHASAWAAPQTLWDYRFSEGSGDQVRSAADDQTGTLLGDYRWAGGTHGQSVEFNGQTGRLQLGGEGFFTLAGNDGITLRTRVRVVKVGETQPIVNAAPTLELEIRKENGAVSFGLTDQEGGSARCTGKTLIADGRWHDVVAQRDPKTKKIRLYIDGGLDAEAEDGTAGHVLPIPKAASFGGKADGREMLGGSIALVRMDRGVGTVAAASERVDESKKQQWMLTNDRLEMKFVARDGSLSLESLIDRKTGTQFIEPSLTSPQNLWQVSLRSPSWSALLDETQGELTAEQSDDQLVFTWSKLPLGDDHATVKLTVDLPADSAMSQWKIDIDHDSKDYGVWIAHSPVISNLARLDQDPAKNFLALPTGLNGGAGEGQLHKDPWNTVEPIVRTYPCYIQSMQFNAWYGPDAGLYLAAHDGKMNLKGFLFKPTPVRDGDSLMSYEVLHYPADAGVEGTTYHQPYPAIVGVFEGDWYDAARIYREWALDQVWCQKGPLRDRENLSPWIKQGAWWTVFSMDRLNDGGPGLREKARTLPLDEVYAQARELNVPSNVERVKRAYEYFGYPMILWCNEWWDGGGDLSSPRYVPMKRLKEFITKMQEEVPDAHLSGHMQTKRYSVQMREWDDQVQQSIEKRADGSWAVEAMGSNDKGDQDAYPCWATEFWQNDWKKRVERIVSYGLDGFHMDELGSYTDFNEQCFNRAHGHPVGGGTLYADTRRNMVTLVRSTARETEPGFALHHEAMCEIYIDVADLAEVCTSPSNNNIPLWEAVYHDYSFIMGRRIIEWFDRNTFPMDTPGQGDHDIDEFTSSFAETFVWGNQPSWTRIDIADYAPKIAAFIKKSMDVRYRVMPYLNVGQMMRPLEVTKPLPTVTRIWRLNDTPEHVLPVVLNSVWKAADGTIGIVLFNHTDQSQTIDYRCDLAACGLEGTNFEISRIDGPQPQELGAVHGRVLERTDTVDPYTVVVLKVAPSSP